MPELPEVQTVVSGLQKSIIGKKISDFDCDTPKMLNYKFKVYRLKLKGLSVQDVKRRAKMIIINLNKDLNVLIHLKMTGQLIYSDKKHCLIGGHTIKTSHKCIPNKFTHASFSFADKSWLYYNDIRKFGWLKIYTDKDLLKYFEKIKLGPEPLTDDFSLEYFKQKIKSRPKSKLKQFLHDPKVVVGIGNIYSDEICFFAKVRPTRRLKTLKNAEIELLYLGIKKILVKAIKMQGTTFSNYVNAEGNEGTFLKMIKVYGRKNLPCYDCGSVIEFVKQGGRTAHYCPQCQK